MHRRSIPLAALFVLFLIQLPAAHAKGPAGAIIEGDGVNGSIEIRHSAPTEQSTSLGRLGEAVGLFELAFGQSPAVVAEQPTKSLGDSRLVITWDMGGGYSIVQELYPHAEGGPVTHVASGQAFFEDSTVSGGWLVITRDIATPLVEVGVDEAAVAPMAKKAATSKAAEPPVKKAAEPPAKEATAPIEAAKTDTATGSTAKADSATASAANPGAVNGVRIAAAVMLLAGIMGAGVWMRRRPVLR